VTPFLEEDVILVKVFLKGLTTGLILQIAIGPIFFYLVNITLQKTLMDGLFAVFAVTIVDYLYILLAIAGVGKILEKEKTKEILGLVSSVILILFGLYMAISTANMINTDLTMISQSQTIFTSFISAFILTISSPLTIVFWTGVFAAKSIEYSFTKKQLLVFGLSAGLATLLFLGSSILVLTVFKTSIPLTVVRAANLVVGLVLILYGIIRAIKISRMVAASIISTPEKNECG